MKYAILADIHANLTALEAVLADIESRGGVNEIWCLGDIVGYGPDPHQCIEIIRKRCFACVAGNHDWAAIGKMDTAYFNPEAAVAAHWTSQQLNTQDRYFLEILPLTLEKDDFTLCHGSPRDPVWEYILSEAEAEENLKYFKTPYCFIGHSHLPIIIECDKICSARELSADDKVTLGKRRFIINPGSVGQPRDGDHRAAYAIYDTDSRTVTHHRLEYDIAAVQKRMREAELPQWLIHRLAHGK